MAFAIRGTITPTFNQRGVATHPLQIEGSIPRTSHVLLVADPQILNANSYPSRPQWLVSLTQFIVDLNLRKSWRLVVRKLAPRAHAVIFLGDMMDGGRDDMSDRE